MAIFPVAGFSKSSIIKEKTIKRGDDKSDFTKEGVIKGGFWTWKAQLHFLKF
ncbi:MAG: hypothetical protein ACJAT4_000300 [Granulosicoccus sp.]